MEIVNPPGWCQDAIPTTEGWTHPNTGKLLKTYGMSQEQVDEYMSRIGKAVEPVDVKVEWKNEHTHDDGTTHSHEGGDSEHTHEEVVVNTNSILTKEEWCKANDIARPGSNYAETEYAKYLAGGA